MTQYAIADIGSNTIVLLVYEMVDHYPIPILHISTPAHLIDYVNVDRIMSKEGILKATEVLQSYTDKLDEMHVQYRFADITEPCRIQNKEELVASLQTTGWEIYPLSGNEEALYDFLGTKYSYPNLKNGIAFDVGGGSTELISFINGKPIDAMSFPLGCVRLRHLPIDTSECTKEILSARTRYPSLNTTCEELIGIGGTMRAAGKVYQALFQEELIIEVTKLQEIFDKLCMHDSIFEEVMKANVDPSRQPVFLPGLHMILEIARIYQAKRILISKTGIREGFLKIRLDEKNERL